MDHQIDITVSDHGREPDNGDRLLGGFEEVADNTDVVIEQNLESGRLTATFFIEAKSIEDAVRAGIVAFASAAAAGGLGPSRVVAVSVAACTPEDAPELALA